MCKLCTGRNYALCGTQKETFFHPKFVPILQTIVPYSLVSMVLKHHVYSVHSSASPNSSGSYTVMSVRSLQIDKVTTSQPGGVVETTATR